MDNENLNNNETFADDSDFETEIPTTKTEPIVEESEAIEVESTPTNETKEKPDAKPIASYSPVESDRVQKNSKTATTLFCILCLLFGLLGGAILGECFQIPIPDLGLFNEVTDPTESTTSAFNDDENKEIVIQPSTSNNTYSVEDIVEANMPALVSIDTVYTYTENYFFFEQEYEAAGAGSGFIIKQENNEISILTNAHVVNDANDITVTFIDGETVKAVLKSLDAKEDLALLAVNANGVSNDTLSKIKCVKLGNSDNLKLGQSVIAIGNCLGYGQTVTTGVVSAVNRVITDDIGNTHSLIQTDAAINAGNSGGVLLDMNGCVIGINEAKIADVAVDGVGFAIPITDAMEIINQLSTVEPKFPVEESKRGKLGITCSTIDANSSRALGLPIGVLIREIDATGCAAKMGMKANDVIVKLNGEDVSTVKSLDNIMQYLASGDEVTIEYKRTTNGSWNTYTAKGTLQ